MMNKKNVALTRAKNQEKGFTLTEIAIVLGIIGLILGAIWVAASSVYSNQKVAKANTEQLTIAQGVRSLFATASTTGAADVTTIAGAAAGTTAMCNAGVFPLDIVTACATPAVGNPWVAGSATAGTFFLYGSITAAGAGDAFVVTMTGVPQAACIAMLSGGSGQGAYWGGVGLPASPLAANNMPMTVATASAACAAGANTVSIGYKLKG